LLLFLNVLIMSKDIILVTSRSEPDIKKTSPIAMQLIGQQLGEVGEQGQELLVKYFSIP
jgi:hypothetical protein